MNIPFRKIGVLCFLVSSFVFSIAPAATKPQDTTAAGELMVKFKAYVTTDTIDEIHRSMGVKVVKRYQAIHLDRIRLGAGASLQHVIESYRSDPNVEYVKQLAVVGTPGREKIDR